MTGGHDYYNIAVTRVVARTYVLNAIRDSHQCSDHSVTFAYHCDILATLFGTPLASLINYKAIIN